MQVFTIQKTPNQEFTALVDGHYIEFRLCSMDGFTFADVKVDGKSVASSLMCVGFSWLIPYRHQHEGFGNFRFETSDEEYPYYTNFGTTCKFYYYDKDEYEAVESGVMT